MPLCKIFMMSCLPVFQASQLPLADQLAAVGMWQAEALRHLLNSLIASSLRQLCRQAYSRLVRIFNNMPSRSIMVQLTSHCGHVRQGGPSAHR